MPVNHDLFNDCVLSTKLYWDWMIPISFYFMPFTSFQWPFLIFSSFPFSFFSSPSSASFPFSLLLLKPIWFPVVNSIRAKTAMKRKLCQTGTFFFVLHSELFVLLAPSEYSWRDSVSLCIWSLTDCQTTVLFQGFGE